MRVQTHCLLRVLLVSHLFSFSAAAAGEPEWVCGCVNPSFTPLLARLGGETLMAPQNSAGPGSGATNEGLILRSNDPKFPARWTQGDRGNSLTYIVDIEVLPTGITSTQALTAVANALAAWSATTSLTFTFGGVQNLGVAANNSDLADDIIYIQMHNNYGAIDTAQSPNVVGIGGFITAPIASNIFNISGAGGQVNGLEFDKIAQGFVVLNHNASVLQNPSTLTEVLTHELGHVFGLSHSSEDPKETDQTKKQAQMYYRVHNDGRGASLRLYDQTIVQKTLPQTNTPPWSMSRNMSVITIPSTTSPFPAGVNTITVYGVDRQTASSALTAVVPLTSGLFNNGDTGAFSVSGNSLIYTPNAYHSDSQAAEGSSFASAYVRVSDGVNCSSWEIIQVTSLARDSAPSKGGDGLPDAWMTKHFKSTTPSSSRLSRATDDPDGDGLTNLQEYRLGTNPKKASSGLNFISSSPTSLVWPVAVDRLYEIEGSQDLSTWERLVNPVLHTDATVTQLSLTLPSVVNSQNRRFHRIRVIH